MRTAITFSKPISVCEVQLEYHDQCITKNMAKITLQSFRNGSEQIGWFHCNKESVIYA